MDEQRPLFEGIDELERTYAPQQLPPDDPAHALVRADEGAGLGDDPTLQEAPAAAPVASPGNSSSSLAAPPNIGYEDRGGAPGDPSTEAREPDVTYDADDLDSNRRPD